VIQTFEDRDGLKHSVEENPIPQQSKEGARGEQQASDINQYICITCIEVV
jgi:hypothetical protein